MNNAVSFNARACYHNLETGNKRILKETESLPKTIANQKAHEWFDSLKGSEVAIRELFPAEDTIDITVVDNDKIDKLSDSSLELNYKSGVGDYTKKIVLSYTDFATNLSTKLVESFKPRVKPEMLGMWGEAKELLDTIVRRFNEKWTGS